MRTPAQIDALTARGQAAAAALMVDALHLERPTGRTIRVDGTTVPERETVWTGHGKVQSQQSYPSQPGAGGGTTTLATFEVHIPATDPVEVLVDDVFVVDTSRDATLAGQRLRVRVDPVKTWRTARRFNCEVIVA